LTNLVERDTLFQPSVTLTFDLLTSTVDYPYLCAVDCICQCAS